MDLEKAAVIGACGKMGRGIAYLVLQEMTLLALSTKKFSSFHLKLIDPNEDGYYELKVYIKQQLLRYAEKKINQLRTFFVSDMDMISNQEMIQKFVETGLSFVDCSSSIETIKGSLLIFEAAFENIPLKIELLKHVHKLAPKAYVFTNTSSIPIGYLAEESKIGSFLIGYHFYNPPVVQKLLEIIPSEWTSPDLVNIANALGKRFNKIMILSADQPGFIGNGHFANEIVYACTLVQHLAEKSSIEEAVQRVDAVSRDLLLRPMGIFQLLDYVGLAVIEQILLIMNLSCPLIDEWFSYGLMGGQTLDGKAKNGIFHYANGIPDAVWSLTSHCYIPLTQSVIESPLQLSWKKIQKSPELLDLPAYFEALLSMQSKEAKLACDYLEYSKGIVEMLIKNKTAASFEDVESVLKNGFFHLYSPARFNTKKDQ